MQSLRKIIFSLIDIFAKPIERTIKSKITNLIATEKFTASFTVQILSIVP